MDVACFVATQKRHQRRGILRSAKTPDTLMAHTLGTHFINGFVLVARTCFEQPLQPFGFRLSRADPVHIHIINQTLACERLRVVRQGCINSTTNHKLVIRCPRSTADNHHNIAMGCQKRRPEQAGEPHSRMKFQGKAILKIGIRLIGKHPAFCCAGTMHQNVAPPKSRIMRSKGCLTSCHLSEIRGVRQHLA